MSKATINLDDKVDKEETLGTLIVVLLKARNLNDKHKFRKQDVFAQASLNGAQKKTHVDIKGGQHPEWDGEVRFTIMKNAAAKYRKLEVSCYAQEPRSEDLLGKGVVDISETLRTGEFDDWVPLDVDGVARGDLYLEMTYYANSPPPVPAAAAPNKHLAAVQSQHNALSRRPSKLSPAERLSRPPVSRPQAQQPQGYPQSRPENHRLHEHYYPTQTPTSPSASPPRGRHATLAGTDARPNPYLSPGPRPGSSGQGQQQPAAPGLPSFLRPGSGGHVQATPTPIPHARGHVRHSSEGVIPSNSYGSPNRYGASPPGVTPSASPSNPYIGPTPPSNPYLGNNGSSTNPYFGGANSTLAPTPIPGPPCTYSPAPQPINTTSPVQAPYTAYGNPQQPPAGGPLLWRSDNMSPPLEAPSNGSFYFPIPAVSPVRESFNHYNTRPGPSPAPPSMDMAYHQRPSPPRDERDLQARYQTPLPLPPGAERPLPKLAPAPPPDPAPMPLYTRPPTPPEKNGTPVPVPDRTRVEAQRRAEEEAARRREQELKDLELAMQLDRELNLAEERAAAAAASTTPGMPGSW